MLYVVVAVGERECMLYARPFATGWGEYVNYSVPLAAGWVRIGWLFCAPCRRLGANAYVLYALCCRLDVNFSLILGFLLQATCECVM